MACGCGGGATQENTNQQEFVVRLPDGTTKVVQGEAAARIEVTMAGSGASYSKR